MVKKKQIPTTENPLNRLNIDFSDVVKTIDELTSKQTNKQKQGIKFDNGKLQWDLLPIEPIEEVIRVLEYGITKGYSKDNWKHVAIEDESNMRYYNACLRHLTAWYKGEMFDPESSQMHLAHAVCCLLFQIWKDSQ